MLLCRKELQGEQLVSGIDFFYLDLATDTEAYRLLATDEPDSVGRASALRAVNRGSVPRHSTCPPAQSQNHCGLRMALVL